MQTLFLAVSLIHCTAAPTTRECGWLAGTWRSPAGTQPACTEIWNVATNGALMGMFRMESGGRPTLYEFQMIEDDDSGAVLRLRHYGPNLSDRDAAPAKLRLTEASDKQLLFTNSDSVKPKRIVYRRDENDKLTVTVETERNGRPSTFELKFVKEK